VGAGGAEPVRVVIFDLELREAPSEVDQQDARGEDERDGDRGRDDRRVQELIADGQQLAEQCSRQPDLVKNDDGSVDLYVGPKAPTGFGNNWVPSVAGKAWFSYFRLYAPTEAHFDRTWILPDHLDVHVVLENLSTHKTAAVHKWLLRHKRTGSSSGR
jgi:hypothetical protein